MLKNKENEGVNKIECDNANNIAIYEHIIDLLLEINENSYSLHKNDVPSVKEKYIKGKKLLEKARNKVINYPVNQINNELPNEIADLLLIIDEFSFSSGLSQSLPEFDKDKVSNNTDIIKPVIQISDLKKELPDEIIKILLKFNNKHDDIIPDSPAEKEVEAEEIIPAENEPRNSGSLFSENIEKDSHRAPVFENTENTPPEELHSKPVNGINISETNKYSMEEINSLGKHFYIYEVGIFMGIIIGKSTKEKVLEIMKYNTGINLEQVSNEPIIYYNDISVNIYFDEFNIVTELEFEEDFKGSTRKGLRIGDTLDRAIELYGEPKLKTTTGAIWDKLKIFYRDNVIIRIKLG